MLNFWCLIFFKFYKIEALIFCNSGCYLITSDLPSNSLVTTMEIVKGADLDGYHLSTDFLIFLFWSTYLLCDSGDRVYFIQTVILSVRSNGFMCYIKYCNFSFWWLVRVSQLSGCFWLFALKWMIVLLLNECSLIDVDNHWWWGHSNPIQ